MKAYRVNVNGNVYEITLEIIDKAEIGTEKPTAPVTTPAATQGSNSITAPMPGTILKINVSNGATVKKGQVLMILEAMKMENEIMAPCDGKVASVNVQQGASVETGTVLCSLE